MSKMENHGAYCMSRNIGYEHFNESEGFLLQEAERYVDEGLCWEIGEVDGEQVLIRTTNKDKR